MKTQYKLLWALGFLLSVHTWSADFIYIVDGLGSVIVVDASSYTEIPGSPFTTTASPPAVAPQLAIIISPNGQRAYVPSFDTTDGLNYFNTVAVFDIDPVTGALSHIPTSPVGGFNRPFSAAVRSDNAFVYVTNLGADSVAVCDINLNILATIPTDSGPASIIVNSAGTHAYIACPGASSVMRFEIIDTAPYLINPISASIAPGANAYEIALNPEETHVYLPSSGGPAATIHRFDLDLTNHLYDAYGAFCIGLAFSSNPPQLFLSGLNDETIYILDPATLLPVALSLTTAMNSALYFVAVNRDQSLLYVSNAGLNNISVFDLTQAGYPEIGGSPFSFAGMNQPFGLAFTPHPTIQPPTNFRGHQKQNNFGLQYEFFNHLKWNPPSIGSVVAYVLYREGVEIARLSSRVQQYNDHNIKKHKATTYSITSVDDAGTESTPVTFTVPAA